MKRKEKLKDVMEYIDRLIELNHVQYSDFDKLDKKFNEWLDEEVEDEALNSTFDFCNYFPVSREERERLLKEQNNLKKITNKLYLNASEVVALEEQCSRHGIIYVNVYMRSGTVFEIFDTISNVINKIYGEGNNEET
jgi:hypothetical protein